MTPQHQALLQRSLMIAAALLHDNEDVRSKRVAGNEGVLVGRRRMRYEA